MHWKDAFVGGAIAAVICLAVAWACQDKRPVVPNTTEYEQAIDLLNKEVGKLVIINDSLVTVIDTAKAKVKVIDHWYEKNLIDITNQSVADDVRFFTDYVSEIGK